jgi:heme oxygenase
MVLIKQVPEAHAFLRKATSRLHKRVDCGSVLTSLTIPGVTRDLYRTAMLALRLAYQEIDSALIQAGTACPGSLSAYTPRVPAIDRDLAAMDARPDRSRSEPGQVPLPSPKTQAAYLGMRYVVEGAQLGGRIIYSRLYLAFGAELNRFGSFWIPGAIPQSSWPDLLRSLALLVTRESLADAARASRATFRQMEMHLAVAGQAGQRD